ncbi:hypothetical protein MNBD_GAMMA11-3332 [hydrothermal vent metagenome]|uniref:Uncharacterized protein n=1 Tax=hydrothermal vent metagenome TaxID=652676 RepID=A0A3B0XFE7_9ZZZZ
MNKARTLQGRVSGCLMLFFLIPVLAFADKKCEAVLKDGIYDTNFFLKPAFIEKSTREIACKARKGNFTFYYASTYLNIAIMEKRCNSSYEKVIKNQYEAKNLETLYNAILGSWANCLKTTEGLKHWVSTIKNTPAQFNYLLDYDARTGPDNVDVNVDMQPQSVWKTCTFRDGSLAKNPVTVTHRKIALTCSRDPNKPVNISISASPGGAQKISKQLVLPAF